MTPFEVHVAFVVFHVNVWLQAAIAEGIAASIIRMNKARIMSNVIQIRMTERELELKWVPVSFFVKKIAEKC